MLVLSVNRKTDKRERESENAADDSIRTDAKLDVYLFAFPMKIRRERDEYPTSLKYFVLALLVNN